MTHLINRIRRHANLSAIAKDERGLSTVEYVIILVLIAAAAVGTWKTFGATIKTKIDDSQSEINGANVKGDQGNSAQGQGQSKSMN